MSAWYGIPEPVCSSHRFSLRLTHCNETQHQDLLVTACPAFSKVLLYLAFFFYSAQPCSTEPASTLHFYLSLLFACFTQFFIQDKNLESHSRRRSEEPSTWQYYLASQFQKDLPDNILAQPARRIKSQRIPTSRSHMQWQSGKTVMELKISIA